MQEYEGHFIFKGTWRLTYLGLVARPQSADVWNPKPVLQVTNFYSDLLYQSFLCAALPLPQRWLTKSNIPKRSGLSLTEFREQYEMMNQPVVITDIVSRCPAPVLIDGYGSPSRKPVTKAKLSQVAGDKSET